MRYIKLGNIFKKLRQMTREIDNYFFYIRQIETMAQTERISHYKLRINKRHGIYGAVNMLPEMLLYYKDAELENLEKVRFGSELAKLNDLFIEYGLMELYKVDYERIKNDDYYAYVFYIVYKWRHCNTTTIVSYSVAIAAILTGMVFAVLKFVGV